MSISTRIAVCILLLGAPGFAQGPGDLSKLSVLEDRAKPGGRKIELAYALLKSSAAKPGAPIVYLDGGPGGSGIGLYRVDEYRKTFDELRSVADVVLLSQRGTGFSTPRLACRDAAPAVIPADIFVSAARMAEVLSPRTLRCAEELRQKGIDLNAYNTNASADDVEDLRKALGVPKVTLFGFSYGVHLALATVRRHPASVDRLILAGTEGPDHTQKLPHTYDLQLARLAQLEEQTDLVEVTRSVLSRLERAPIEVDAKGTKLVIGKEGFQYLLRQDIGDTNDTKNLLRMIRDTARGDYAILGAFAARRFGEFGAGVGLMGFAMDCASGASAERMARINREIANSLLGMMTNYPFPMICDALKIAVLPASFREPIFSPAPALFISGSLDSNTPPYQAEEVRWGFPNSVHVIVENAGHESTLTLPAVRGLMVDFLLGRDVGGRTVAAPRVLLEQ
jgi:pimeloyl-ACP methyl ester carboxylesterase